MKAALLMPRARLSEKAIKLIDGKNFGNLAFVMSDGSPHVSPVWVDREGDLILVNTAEGRAKAKYLKANHRVALSIFNQQDPYEKVVIRLPHCAVPFAVDGGEHGTRPNADQMGVSRRWRLYAVFNAAIWTAVGSLR